MEQCKKCGSSNWSIRFGGKHYGAYCSDCGAFIKWIKKAEAEEILKTAVAEVDKQAQEPCEFCYEDDIVVVRAYGDSGISSWDWIDAKFCPVCGRKKRKGGGCS